MRPTVSGSQLNWAFCGSNTHQTSHPPDSSLHQSAPTDLVSQTISNKIPSPSPRLPIRAHWSSALLCCQGLHFSYKLCCLVLLACLPQYPLPEHPQVWG